jgi:tetratricopeptide (TPR) repeat protein
METEFERRLQEILSEYPEIDPAQAALALKGQPGATNEQIAQLSRLRPEEAERGAPKPSPEKSKSTGSTPRTSPQMMALLKERWRVRKRLAKAHQQAITEYNKLIEKNPLDHEAYNSRGESHLKFENYQQATEDFNRAIIALQQSIIGPEAKYFRNRGLAYEKLGNGKQAIEDMKTAAMAGDKEAQKYLLSKEMTW